MDFRVPKKKKDAYELLSVNSDEKESFLSKIRESFKKPEISLESMKFHKWWSININEAEAAFFKKRSTLGKPAESFGFLYVKTEYELKQIVNIGKLEIGNLKESYLGNASFGVSLSQCADIYHPTVPKAGILLIIKYLKGKVNYLPLSKKPIDMEPDPNFNCHIIRSSSTSDTIIKAFHSTQVFLYEYDEDVDIVKCPSQILMVGAVQFSWHGPYIYRDTTRKDPLTSHPTKRVNMTPIESGNSKRPHLQVAKPVSQTKLLCPLSVLPHGDYEIISSSLIIGSMANDSTASLKVKLMSKLREPIMISNLISQNWNLIELLSFETFRNYLLSLDQSQMCKPFQLRPSVINVLHDNSFIDSKQFHPRFAVHLSMVPESFKDVKVMSRLIEKLHDHNLVGQVRCNSLSDMFFYIFSSGKISKSLGLSAADASNSLHVILLTEQHPQFLQCYFSSKDKDHRKEQILFQEALFAFEQRKFPVKPLISRDALKTLIASQKKSQNKSVGHSISNEDSDMDIDSNHEFEVEISVPNGHNATVATAPLVNHFVHTMVPVTTAELSPNQIVLNPVNITTKIPNLPLLDIRLPQSHLPDTVRTQYAHISILQTVQCPHTNNPSDLAVNQSNPISLQNNRPTVPFFHPIPLSDQSELTVLPRPPEPVIPRPNFFQPRILMPTEFTRAQFKYRSKAYRDFNSVTNRRPVHLDGIILEKVPDLPSVTVYKGFL